MKVRQFGLKNAKSTGSEMYDLMDIRHYFNEPNGLGWGIDATVKRLGQTFVATEENTKQPGPKGEMWFATYELYEEFLRFCQVGGLVLCYKPSEQISWRYLDCSIAIEKSEIDHEHGYLNCGVTFTGTSRWYEDPVSYQSDDEVLHDTKEYAPNEGEYGYYYKHNDDAIWNNGDEVTNGVKASETNYYYRYAVNDVFVTIDNGVIDSYFTLTIFGPCTNPEYRLYKDGTVLHSGKINVDVPANQKLVIVTYPKRMEVSIYTVTDKFLSNAYGKSDFTTERIFAVPPGRSSMAIADDNSRLIKFNVEVMKVV